MALYRVTGESQISGERRAPTTGHQDEGVDSDNDLELEQHATLRSVQICDAMLSRPAAAHTSARGRATVTELGPDSPRACLEEAFRAIRAVATEDATGWSGSASRRAPFISISVALPSSEATVPTGCWREEAEMGEVVHTPLGQMLIDSCEITWPVSLACPSDGTDGLARVGSVVGACPMPLITSAMEADALPMGAAAAAGVLRPGAAKVKGKSTTFHPTSSAGVCAGVAVCWSHSSCTFFHIPSSTELATLSADKESACRLRSYLGDVWESIQGLLSDPGVAKCMFAARQQFSCLLAMHRTWLAFQCQGGGPLASVELQPVSAYRHTKMQLHLAGDLVDPQAMLWSRMASENSARAGGEASAMALKSVLSTAVSDYSLLVPMNANSAVRRACRFALAR